jgi:hypothetical protein
MVIAGVGKRVAGVFQAPEGDVREEGEGAIG